MSDTLKKVWTPFEVEIRNCLNDLHLVPYVLLTLVVEYLYEDLYQSSAFQIWSYKSPLGISSDTKENIYLSNGSSLIIYNPLTGKPKGEIPPGSKEERYGVPQRGYSIDFNADTKVISVIEQDCVYQYNVTDGTLKGSWKLPVYRLGRRAMKIDGERVYYTIGGLHQIFVYSTVEPSQRIAVFGSEGASEVSGEFNCPFGLDLQEECLFICDTLNHRVQILHKLTGVYLTQWGDGREGTNNGQFRGPLSVFLQKGLAYVGDWVSVQIFTTGGIFLQRLGSCSRGHKDDEFSDIISLCVLNENLFVCDTMNHRIKVFRRMDSD